MNHDPFFLPKHFLDICTNRIINQFQSCNENIHEMVQQIWSHHLQSSPQRFFHFKQYSDRSYVLYPRSKEAFRYELFLLQNLKGLKNDRLKEGLGYIFPLYQLQNLQSFLLQLNKYKLSSLISSAERYDWQEQLKLFFQTMLPHLNKILSPQESLSLLHKSISDDYDKRKLESIIHNNRSVNEILLSSAKQYYFFPDKTEVEIFIKAPRFWTKSILFSLQDVRLTQRYLYAKNYSPLYNPYYITTSMDHHIAILEHSSYTGD